MESQRFNHKEEEENDSLNPKDDEGTDGHFGKISIAATTETLIEDEIGCGPFQGLIILLVTILAKVPTAATFMFMSFGNYNPGWTCLHDNGDNNNKTTTNNVSTGAVSNYGHGTCEEFEACTKIQFNPDSSTIVTE